MEKMKYDCKQVLLDARISVSNHSLPNHTHPSATLNHTSIIIVHVPGSSR
jgi:hypothetical protein